MKSIFIFALILFSFTFYGQEQEKIKLKYMPVYPGCESIPKDDKSSLTQCFAQNIQKDLMYFLDTEYPVTLSTIDEDYLRADFNFLVGKDGKIKEFTIEKSDHDFKKIAEKAFREYIDFMDVTNKIIQPGVDENGNNVELIFTTAIVLSNPYKSRVRKKLRKKLLNPYQK